MGGGRRRVGGRKWGVLRLGLEVGDGRWEGSEVGDGQEGGGGKIYICALSYADSEVQTALYHREIFNLKGKNIRYIVEK